MRKTSKLICLVLIISLTSLSYLGFIFGPSQNVYALASSTNLHYIASNENIGDVHPYYNTTTNKWYMTYLSPTGYWSKLLTSTDKINWTPQTYQHSGTPPLEPYYILGTLKSGSTYYSYYGNQQTMEVSQSSDLLNWQNGSNIIYNDLTTFPATSRDPYVFFDPDANVYRCISSAYRANNEWGYGSTIDVSLALTSTSANNLTSWGSTQTELIRFANGYNGEPECPQMMKIGNRWYLFASMARRALNNGNVGPISYWIGDANTPLTSVNWVSKTEYILDGQDLCAPQIAFDGTKYILWGWIPNSATATWGGHISLAREVQQQSDGTLTLKLDSDVGNAIRAEQLTTLAAQTITSGTTKTFSGTYNRCDLSVTLTNDYTSQIIIGNTYIQFAKATNEIKVFNGGTTTYAKCTTPANGLSGTLNIRVIAEGDIVEVFVNDKYSLAAKSAYSMSNASVRIKSVGGSTPLSSATLYRLKYREEVGKTVNANDQFAPDTTSVSWGLQNNNNWYFDSLVKSTGVYSEMPFTSDFGGSFSVHSQYPYCFINREVYHCAAAASPVKVFKAPRGGNITVTVDIKRTLPDVSEGGTGPSMYFYIKQNNTQVFPSDGTKILMLANNGAYRRYTVNLDVKKNTNVYLITECAEAKEAYMTQSVTYNSVNDLIE